MCAKMRMGEISILYMRGCRIVVVLTYYAEYNVSISHFISFYRERLSDNAVLIASGMYVYQEICFLLVVPWHPPPTFAIKI